MNSRAHDLDIAIEQGLVVDNIQIERSINRYLPRLETYSVSMNMHGPEA